MASYIGRRKFLATLGSAAAAWPLAGRAQQPMPVIGFLNGQSPGPFAHLLAGFHRGLNQTGFVEGRNIAIEYRWAEGHTDRMVAMAADLVRRGVAVIVATGGAHHVAKAATTTIPIVCTIGADPVRDGLVASINRPGGNVTGASVFSAELEAKRLELLVELVPKATLIGILVDPNFSETHAQAAQTETVGRALGREIRVVRASSESEIEAAFSELVEAKAGAIAVAANPFLNSRRSQVVTLAERYGIPAIYEYRQAPEIGGLISYGPSVPDVYRQVGVYAGRILNGEKPADLPVVQPAKFELLINLRAAKALGLEVPPTLLARADEVIE
jgi:putative tryptophan/tyrosine transport system substrate-binding protein